VDMVKLAQHAVLREELNWTVTADGTTLYTRQVSDGEQWEVRWLGLVTNSADGLRVEMHIATGGRFVPIGLRTATTSQAWTGRTLQVVLREGERIRFVLSGGTVDALVELSVLGVILLEKPFAER